MQDGLRLTGNSQIFCTENDMAYFPFFHELDNKNITIIGGGNIALEKIERLAGLGADITVIAPEIKDEIFDFPKVTCIIKRYAPEDLSGADFVISATGDEKIDIEVFEKCRAQKTPVNVVDVKDKCDFIFPSVIRKKNLVIGVSSSGASPQVAITLRKEIENLIPDNIEDILDFLEEIRPVVKNRVDDPKIRHRILKRAADICLRDKRTLSAEELEELLINERES